MDLEITARAEVALLARQRLPERYGPDALLPSYDGLGLANLAALAASWVAPEMGAPVGAAPVSALDPHRLGDAAVSRAWDAWLARGPIRHVVVLLSDALGYDQMCAMMTDGTTSGLARAVERPQAFFMPITTVYPSTTTTALTTLASAYAPAVHGIMATVVYVREIGATVNLIGYRPATAPTTVPYLDTQLNPDTLVPVPNLFRRLEQAGVHTEIVNAREYKGSSISRFTTAGSEAGKNRYHGYITQADGLAQVRARIEANGGRPASYTYVYAPSVDSTAHRYGPLAASNRAESAALDFALGRTLLDGLVGRPDTVLILTADHGQVIARPEQTIWLNDHPALMRMLAAPITGERRAGYLHLQHGMEKAAAAYIEQHLGHAFITLSRSEATSLGLFGPPGQPLAAVCADRIGDLLLVPKRGWTVQQHLPSEERHAGSVGVHGGLSRAEMLVPFVAYRFE